MPESFISSTFYPQPPPAPPIHRSQDESISAAVFAKEKNNKSNVSVKEKNNVLKKENIECVKEKIESMKESDSMQKVRATTPQVKIKLSIIRLFVTRPECFHQ